MATTKYSHAFLVGRINVCIEHNKLLDDGWIYAPTSSTDYNDYCTKYYKGHVNAMVEVENIKRPEFLKNVRHYEYHINRNVCINDYNFKLICFHLNFFPLGITLLSIEVDDSGNDLNTLTWGHSYLIGWNEKYDGFPVLLKKYVSPLAQLLSTYDLSQLCADGCKLKLYQIINTSFRNKTERDTLLYEIATSSPIGCVNKNLWISPSEDYYQQIMQTNSISAYKEWKALALVDSFTLISDSQKPEYRKTWDDYYKLWNNHYFKLIYLRCVFEKTFCLSRNNYYREGEIVEDLSNDISNMERYYFYNNISYSFLPNMLYEAMAKGLLLKEERDEISKQIKERAIEEKRKKKEIENDNKEKEEKRFNNILAGLSLFAVISVVWDFCSIVKNAFNVQDGDPGIPYIAWGFIALGAAMITFFWNKIYKK